MVVKITILVPYTVDKNEIELKKVTELRLKIFNTSNNVCIVKGKICIKTRDIIRENTVITVSISGSYLE